MIGIFKKDQNGNVINEVSSYNPSQEVKDLTSQIVEDYTTGNNIMNTPYPEFNDRSPIEEMNANQRAFNAYRPPRSNDPLESWRAFTVRPLTRAKVISIAAHITSGVIYPNVFAQDGNDKEDREAAQVMRSLIEWVVRNSNYEESFLFSVISMCVNPAVIMKAEYSEVFQTIKKKLDDGTITEEEVIDEVLSGFQLHVVPMDELLINNIYEYDIQRQKCLIRRRYIDYSEAKALWGDHDNFTHIQPGMRHMYNNNDGQFYHMKDEDHPTLVEEVTYYNRREDIEVTFVNGILVTDKDQRMKNRDQKDRPVYPFVKGGYEPIDEKRFFYYKSLVSKLGPDQEVLDQMWNMMLDGTFLAIQPPQNIYSGQDRVNPAVVIPGASNFFDPDSRVEPMKLGTNFQAAYNAIDMLEGSMTENSQDPRQAGVSGPRTTASQFLGEQQNARIALGLFGKMVGSFIRDLGKILVPLIIHNMSTAQVDELTGGETRIRYRSFLLQDGSKKGESKRIVFTDSLIGRKITDRELKEMQFKQIGEEGGIKSNTRIFQVNPYLFSKLNYMLYVDADDLVPKNSNIEKALKLEAYDRMIQNPVIDVEAVTREFLVEALAPGESDKYIKSKAMQQLMQPEMNGPEKTPIVEQLTSAQSLTGLGSQ